VDATRPRQRHAHALERIALCEDDLAGLPSYAAATKKDTKKKKGDPRYAWYVERFGNKCWELDAMNPNDLRARVEAHILTRIDFEAWHRAEVVEQAETASLRAFLDQWNGILGRASE
jgi:hypothetical protein